MGGQCGGGLALLVGRRCLQTALSQLSRNVLSVTLWGQVAHTPAAGGYLPEKGRGPSGLPALHAPPAARPSPGRGGLLCLPCALNQWEEAEGL